jgi:hypothetical protein
MKRFIILGDDETPDIPSALLEPAEILTRTCPTRTSTSIYISDSNAVVRMVMLIAR